MKKVYVAGKLNAMTCDYIKNCHDMITTADKIRRLGFSVFVPCLDILSGLVKGDYTYLDYFENNLPWLQAADAVFVLPDSKESKGTQAEIEIARIREIPIFDSIPALMMWGQR